MVLDMDPQGALLLLFHDLASVPYLSHLGFRQALNLGLRLPGHRLCHAPRHRHHSLFPDLLVLHPLLLVVLPCFLKEDLHLQLLSHLGQVAF